MVKTLTKEEVREIVNEKYLYKNSIRRFFGSSTYEEYDLIENSQFRNRQQTKDLRIYISKTPFIILLVVATFFLATFPFFNAGKPTSSFLKILYCISLLCIVISTYKIFSSKILYIQILPNSFKMKKREVFWNEIEITGILRSQGKNSSHEFLIVGLNTGEILQIDIDKSDINTRDFIQIINLNKTQYTSSSAQSQT